MNEPLYLLNGFSFALLCGAQAGHMESWVRCMTLGAIVFLVAAGVYNLLEIKVRVRGT